MKKTILLISIALLGLSCQHKEKPEQAANDKYASFGDSISQDGALSREEMFAKYAALNVGDTIDVKFRSEIKDVCSKKGCWMNLAMPAEEEVFVKFKDYAFFVPLNSKGNEAIVKGKAFLTVESVEDLKHYAKDAGKSQAAIDSITKPQNSYTFMASGVLIKE